MRYALGNTTPRLDEDDRAPSTMRAGGQRPRPALGVVMLLANLDGSVGGAQAQAALLASELARQGLRVFVVNQAPRLRLRAHTRPDGGVTRVSLPVLPWGSRWTFLFSFLVWAVGNRHQFAIIHAHSTAAGITAGLVGRLLGKPVLAKVTGMQSVTVLGDPRLAWRARRWLVDRTVSVLVAVSAEMTRAMAHIGIDSVRTALIPNGVRTTPGPGADRGATRVRWLGDTVQRVVLYVGRLEPVKGVSRLLAAWAAMPRDKDLALLIVGDGPLRGDLERQASASGIGGSVRFLGSHSDVRPFYEIADVFVLPSESEGFSNALLEAMAAGLPVVASDVGGNRDVVAHGVDGLLVDWEHPATAGRLVTLLLGDSEQRRRLGEAARQRAQAFSIATTAERHRELYESLLATSRRGKARP
jgi:glycosyltransferase involved in cell wall biosynthesis